MVGNYLRDGLVIVYGRHCIYHDDGDIGGVRAISTLVVEDPLSQSDERCRHVRWAVDRSRTSECLVEKIRESRVSAEAGQDVRLVRVVHETDAHNVSVYVYLGDTVPNEVRDVWFHLPTTTGCVVDDERYVGIVATV